MNHEKAKGPGYEDLQYRESEMMDSLVSDYKAGKALHWPLVSKSIAHKVWERFSRTGRVSDDRLLDTIFTTLRDNIVRLSICNIVSGHENISPDHLLEEYFDPNEYEAFVDWLVETGNTWRISDYGIIPLRDAIALAFEAKTSELRLKFLDRVLHITHMRNDLSLLFIEGGRISVTELDAKKEEPFEVC